MGNLGSFCVVAGVVLVDVLTKTLVRYLYRQGNLIFFRTGFFSLRYVENPGGAFGIFPRRSSLFLFVTFLAVVLMVYLLFFSSVNHFFIQIGLAVLLGGSCGNLIDRLVDGVVLDFLQFGSMPIFNIADIAIVSGTVLIVLGLVGGNKLIET